MCGNLVITVSLTRVILVPWIFANVSACGDHVSEEALVSYLYLFVHASIYLCF